MVYKTKKKLKKLSDYEIAEDVKKYINFSHTFYETKVPEIEVLAKKLHEEYNLDGFYKVFNRLWNTGYKERSLAISALQLYKDDFDLNTWRILKPKLKDIKSSDKADIISDIIGEILRKNKSVKADILKLSRTKNMWFKRIALMSLVTLIKNNDVDFASEIVKMNINDKNKYVQEAVGFVLREIGNKKPNVAKKIILKNIHMPADSFAAGTEKMKELRKLRSIKKLNTSKANRLFFWKKI